MFWVTVMVVYKYVSGDSGELKVLFRHFITTLVKNYNVCTTHLVHLNTKRNLKGCKKLHKLINYEKNKNNHKDYT